MEDACITSTQSISPTTAHQAKPTWRRFAVAMMLRLASRSFSASPFKVYLILQSLLLMVVTEVSALPKSTTDLLMHPNLPAHPAAPQLGDNFPEVSLSRPIPRQRPSPSVVLVSHANSLLSAPTVATSVLRSLATRTRRQRHAQLPLLCRAASGSMGRHQPRARHHNPTAILHRPTSRGRLRLRRHPRRRGRAQL